MDDTVLMATRTIYSDFCTVTENSFNMKISVEQTQSKVIPKEPIRCKLVPNNRTIQLLLDNTYR